jgi:competence protein ComGC
MARYLSLLLLSLLHLLEIMRITSANKEIMKTGTILEEASYRLLTLQLQKMTIGSALLLV